MNGQLGLEKTPDESIAKLVAGFRELRRILRDDGTLWVNYGDKYCGTGYGKDTGNFNNRNNPNCEIRKNDVEGLEGGNLLGLAWRLALALQADGWILRSDIIWAKGLSFCEAYSGSVMPESVNGWRWERCRIKVKSLSRPPRGNQVDLMPGRNKESEAIRANITIPSAEWADCPGCSKCEKNGGLVLRKGSWRCTKAYEHLFQFAKQQGYFCDMQAVREKNSEGGRKRIESSPGTGSGMSFGCNGERKARLNNVGFEANGRNLRDVWVINPQPWGRAHYATFPEKLIEPIIKVSTSQKGVCPKCGSQWCRVVDSKQIKRERPNAHVKYAVNNPNGQPDQTMLGVETTTLGWRATCDCGCPETVPAIVYDCFMGSGTVAAVAARLGRNYAGSELSKDYIEQQSNFRIAEAETGVSMNEIEQGQKGLF